MGIILCKTLIEFTQNIPFIFLLHFVFNYLFIKQYFTSRWLNLRSLFLHQNINTTNVFQVPLVKKYQKYQPPVRIVQNLFLRFENDFGNVLSANDFVNTPEIYCCRGITCIAYVSIFIIIINYKNEKSTMTLIYFHRQNEILS